jgi:hypothetical protein
MTKKILFVLCFFCQYQSVFSQIPGYLGKRFFTSVNVSAFPTISGPSADNNALGRGSVFGISQSTFDLTTRFGFEIGYALSRKRALRISFDYYKTGLNSSAYTQSKSSVTGRDEYALFYHLNAYTLDIGYQRYLLSKGAIAPMGMYFTWHANVTRAKGNAIYESSFEKTYQTFKEDPNYITGGFGFEIGNNLIFADRFFINTAVKFNVGLGYIQSEIDDNIGVYDNHTIFVDNAGARTFYHSLMMFKIGIGILN